MKSFKYFIAWFISLLIIETMIVIGVMDNNKFLVIFGILLYPITYVFFSVYTVLNVDEQKNKYNRMKKVKA